MWNLALPTPINWRTSFPPIESIQDPNIAPPIEDEGEPPKVLGDFLKDGRLAWQSMGPHLRVISTDDGVVRTNITFGASIHDDTAQVTCAIEFPERRLPGEESDPNFPPLLIVGVGSDLTGGYVHVYHAGTCKILRSIHFTEKVTALSLVLCNPSEISPLSPLLKNMGGVLAVGTLSGKTYLIDLRRNDILKAISAPFKEVRNEAQYCSVQLISPDEDTAETMEEQIQLCKVNGNHLGLILNAKREKDLDFPTSCYDDTIYVSKMLYIPETTTLVIGFNFSGFQLWDVAAFQLLFSSKRLRNKMPVAGLGFLDPADDPTQVCYLWVLYESPIEVSGSRNDLPFGFIFNCTYESKQFVPDYGNYFLNFLTINKSFELDLPSALGTEGRLISCQKINKITPLPRISFLPNPDNGDEGVSLDLFMIVFEFWLPNGASRSTQMVLFDLNQWYKAQFPACGRPDLASSYLSIKEIKFDLDSAILAVYIDKSSVEQFAQLINVEQYFFPSALSFDFVFMSSEHCISSHQPGAQRYALKKLETEGPNSLLRPNHLYDLCISVSLKPFLCEVIPDYELTHTEQRNFVLSLALEYGLIKCITDCIKQWADGRHCVSGCTLPAVIHWAWERVSLIKQHADRLCVPLFDYSGTKLDSNGLRSLEHCRAQMAKALQVFKYIQSNHSNDILTSTLEHRINALERVCEYYYAVLWFLNTGLLPEHLTMTLVDPHSKSEKVFVLNNVMGTLHKKCSVKRIELKRLLLKVKQDYEQYLTSVSSLYLIDCFIDEDKGGQSLISQWERESNGSSLGHYPPVALQYLLRIFLIHGVEYSTKIGIIFYFLLDVCDFIKKENSSCDSVINRLMSFSYGFGLKENVKHIIHAMWYIDHENFERGVDILVEHENCKGSIQMWLHRAILRVLLFHNQAKLALKYLQTIKPPLAESQDILFHLNTLLTNGLLSQAFLFQRKYGLQEADLLLRFFDGCEKLGQLKNVLALPLTPTEEDTFTRYLDKSKSKQADDLRVFYLLARGRYTEAVDVNTQLQGLRSNVSSAGAANSSKQTNACTRDIIIGAISKTLPNITRQLSAFCSAQRNTLHNVKHVDRPTPLSMMVHTDSSPKSLPALPFYKSSNEAIMQSAVDKTKEIWSSLLATPAASKAQRLHSIVENTPFLRTPNTVHQRADPLSIFDSCVQSTKKSCESKRHAASPIESDFVPCSKRIRTGEKGNTSKFTQDKPWNLSQDLSDDALVFLRTPVVQRKVTPVSILADRSTPLSILKGSSNHTPKRSVQRSVTYQVTPDICGDNSEATSKAVVASETKAPERSAARQIRFSFPNESEEEKSSSKIEIATPAKTQEKTSAKAVAETSLKPEDDMPEVASAKPKKSVTLVTSDTSSPEDVVTPPSSTTRFRQARQSIRLTPRQPLRAYLSSSDDSKISESDSKSNDASIRTSDSYDDNDPSTSSARLSESNISKTPQPSKPSKTKMPSNLTSTPITRSTRSSVSNQISEVEFVEDPSSKLETSRSSSSRAVRFSEEITDDDANKSKGTLRTPRKSPIRFEEKDSSMAAESDSQELAPNSTINLTSALSRIMEKLNETVNEMSEKTEQEIALQTVRRSEENKDGYQDQSILKEQSVAHDQSPPTDQVSVASCKETITVEENPSLVSTDMKLCVSPDAEDEPMDVDESEGKRFFGQASESAINQLTSTPSIHRNTPVVQSTESFANQPFSTSFAAADVSSFISNQVVPESSPQKLQVESSEHSANQVASESASGEKIPVSATPAKEAPQEAEEDEDDDIICLDSSSDNETAPEKDDASASSYEEEYDSNEESYSSKSDDENVREKIKNIYGSRMSFGSNLAQLEPLNANSSRFEKEQEGKDVESNEVNEEREEEIYSEEEEAEEEEEGELEEEIVFEGGSSQGREFVSGSEAELDGHLKEWSENPEEGGEEEEEEEIDVEEGDELDENREKWKEYDSENEVEIDTGSSDGGAEDQPVEDPFEVSKTLSSRKDSIVTGQLENGVADMDEYGEEVDLVEESNHSEAGSLNNLKEVDENDKINSSMKTKQNDLNDNTPALQPCFENHVEPERADIESVHESTIATEKSYVFGSQSLIDVSSTNATVGESYIGSSQEILPVGGYLSSSEGGGTQVTVIETEPAPLKVSDSTFSIGKIIETNKSGLVSSPSAKPALDSSHNSNVDISISENEATVGSFSQSCYSESDHDVSRSRNNRTWMFEKRINDDSVEEANKETESETSLVPSFIFGNLNDVSVSITVPETSQSSPADFGQEKGMDVSLVSKAVEIKDEEVNETIGQVESKILPTEDVLDNSLSSSKVVKTPISATPTRVLRSRKKDESLSDTELSLSSTKRKRSLSIETTSGSETPMSLDKKRHHGSDSMLSVSHSKHPCMPEKALLQAVMRSSLWQSPGTSVVSNMSNSQSLPLDTQMGDDSSSAQSFPTKTSGSLPPEAQVGDDSSSTKSFRNKTSDSSSSSQFTAGEKHRTRRAASIEALARFSPCSIGESSKAQALREKRLAALERRKSKLGAVFTSLDHISELPESETDRSTEQTSAKKTLDTRQSNLGATFTSADHLPESAESELDKKNKRMSRHLPPAADMPALPKRSSFLRTRSSENFDSSRLSQPSSDSEGYVHKRRSILNLSKLKKPRQSASFKSRQRGTNYKFKEMDVAGSDDSTQESDVSTYEKVLENKDDDLHEVSHLLNNVNESVLSTGINEANNENTPNESIASRVGRRRTRRQSVESVASSQDFELPNLDDSITSQVSAASSVRTRASSIESIPESGTSDVSQRYRRVSIRRRSTPLYSTKDLRKSSIRHKYAELDVIASEEEMSDQTSELNETTESKNAQLPTSTPSKRGRNVKKVDSVKGLQDSETDQPPQKQNTRKGKSPAKKTAPETPVKGSAKKQTNQKKNAKPVSDYDSEDSRSTVSTRVTRRSSLSLSQSNTPEIKEQDEYTTNRRLTRHQNAILKKMEDTNSPVINSPITRSRRLLNSSDLNSGSELERTPGKRTRNGSPSSSISSKVSRSSSRR